jgi:glutaminyl-tRNA synthetase
MIRTRFPPEPNGYLHLGHVKAMQFDFGYHPDCHCTLRLDDTNPETERAEFVDSIIEDVKWMGYKYDRVTYTSDYFPQLYEFAEQLILADKAYVDFSSPEEIKAGRLNGTESEWRYTRSPETHLNMFRAMRQGTYPDGWCVLRLKIDMKHPNANLRDPIAYRIKRVPHYRTGTDWIIYPSYDYSHGIVDALEGITHSYCTTEFLVRRPQYLWPVEQLGLTPATVVEFGRLNVEGVNLSKRKIIPLIENGTLDGYDDPRLFTIRGLRRRGFTPELLKQLADLSSIERRDTELARPVVLHHLRAYYDKVAPRAFAVLDPLRVVMDTGKDVFIDRADFREVDSPDYYRMAPGKTVRLRFGPCITYVSHDAEQLQARDVGNQKVKGIIHWVPADAALPAIFEEYEDIDVNSQKTIRSGLIHKDVIYGGGEVYQFERVGYFRFDRMFGDIPVFIKIVGLLNKFAERAVQA